jgi:hypothetical protein
MVIAEGENRCDGPNQVPENDVEGMVPEIPPPRACDEDRSPEWDEGKKQEIEWRRRGLSPDRGNGLIVSCYTLVSQRRV